VIFGFNTDVKFENTVYHVQSEAREHELRLETQIFLRGRCIEKHATSYAEQMKQPGFSEEQMHEMLKDQHKHFVEAVREGRIEAELDERLERGPEQPLPAAGFDLLDEMVADAYPAPQAGAPDALLGELEELPPPIHAAPAPLLDDDNLFAPSEPPAVELKSWPPLDDAPPPAIIEPEPLPASVEGPSPFYVPPEAAPEIDDGMPSLDELAAQYAAGTLRITPPARKPPKLGWSLSPIGKLIGKGVDLECLPPAASPDGNEIIIAVRVSDESGPAAGAQVTCRVTSGNLPANYVYSTSGAEGVAGINLAIHGLDLASTALLVQASHRGKSAGRKYKLQSSS
jgi:hypothetical protein